MVWRQMQLGIKRIFDVSLSLMLIVLFTPAITLLSLLVVLTSPGPVFKLQSRVGLNGKMFTIIKLRTIEDKNSKPFRVTMLGKPMRRWGIDELPQLINILKGDMSFFGPRPLLPVSDEGQYAEHRFIRRSMRPGLLSAYGLAIHIEPFQDDELVIRSTYDQLAVDLDLAYIHNWHLGKDLWLAVMSIYTGFRMVYKVVKSKLTP